MDVQEYLVTLSIRPAEMSGLKELPSTTKDRLTPLVLLAPWLSTTPLTRAIDKFEESYPSRPYFIDIDNYYKINDKLNDAKELWAKLAHKPADLSSWWDLLSAYPHANPCLLISEQPIDKVREQIKWAREHNRNFCIRLNFAEGNGLGAPPWMHTLVAELAEEGASDYAVVFEFGWIQDPLLVAAGAIAYKNKMFSAIPATIPVAISYTSFPKEFTPYDGTREEEFSNRKIIAQVRRETNHLKIVYGDWGTTRPRSHERASQPKNRIDYPTDNSWIFVRNQAQSIDFKTAASRIIESKFWSGKLGIWGEQLIEGAAAGQPFAIDSMPKMYAARINIHLHRQAFYGQLPPPEALDEAWSDDDF